MPAHERSPDCRYRAMSDHDEPTRPFSLERPSCVRAGDSFTLRWPDTEIEAIVTIVGEDRRCLEAELLFTTTTNHGHVLRRRMDLLVGTRGRNDVIKDLKPESGVILAGSMATIAPRSLSSRDPHGIDKGIWRLHDNTTFDRVNAEPEVSRFRSARCAIAVVPGMCGSSTPGTI
jgi:hypothetical protein